MDGAPEPYRLTGTAVVDIELTDVNDESPKIEILIAQNSAPSASSIGSDRLHFGTGSGGQSGAGGDLVAYIKERPSPDIVIAYIQVCSPYF